MTLQVPSLNFEAPDYSPRQLVNIGMQKFKEGNIDESIEYFDRAEKSVPGGALKPYLWQRGISYYYADRFEEGSEQVRERERVE